MSAQARSVLGKIERVPLDSLIQHPDNPRRGNVAAIAESLDVNQQYEPLIVQLSTGRVLAGNHRLLAAESLGWDTIDVVNVDVDDEHALRILLSANRTADLATYDEQALAEQLQALAGLTGTGYTDGDLDEMLDRLRQDAAEQRRLANLANRQDVVPDPPAKAKSVMGEMYELGPHRIMCGDSAAIGEFVKGVEVTVLIMDPPYGISLDTDYSKMPKSTRTYRPVEGDAQPFDAAPLREILVDVPEQFWFGADYYAQTLGDTEHSGAWLVWDKRVEDRYDGGFGSAFELCWSAERRQRRVLRHQWFQNHAEDPREAGDRLHPTQKPAALIGELIEMASRVGDIVCDPFAGSGSTIIAAEQTGRVCYACEIDPLYVDVIRQRFADYTDQPELAPR